MIGRAPLGAVTTGRLAGICLARGQEKAPRGGLGAERWEGSEPDCPCPAGAPAPCRPRRLPRADAAADADESPQRRHVSSLALFAPGVSSRSAAGGSESPEPGL